MTINIASTSSAAAAQAIEAAATAKYYSNISQSTLDLINTQISTFNDTYEDAITYCASAVVVAQVIYNNLSGAVTSISDASSIAVEAQATADEAQQIADSAKSTAEEAQEIASQSTELLYDVSGLALDAKQTAIDASAVTLADLSSSEGSSLVGFIQSGTGATLRTLQDKERERRTPQDYDLVSDGSTDISSGLADLTGTLELPPGTYRIGSSVTVSAQIRFAPGAILSIASGVSLTLSTIVSAPDCQIFSLDDDTAKVLLPKNGYVNFRWWGIAEDGTEAADGHLSNIIADAPDLGRHVEIPAGATYLIDSYIDLAGMNFITLSGTGRGLRSNVDTAGTWVGGGSRFVLGSSATYAIYDPKPSGTYDRASGLRIQNLSISGYSGATDAQTGIFLERDSDGAQIEGIALSNFNGGTGSCCINLSAADSARISGCSAFESTSALALGDCKETQVEGCHLGAQPGGITINASSCIRLNISGNNVFPDGYSAIILNDVTYSLISSNVVSSRFTGVIELIGSSYNTFSDNLVRVPNDASTSWTDGKSTWSSTNYDPLDRDELYGLIYLDATSNYNVISGGSINSWTDNSSACGIRVKTGAVGNMIANIKFCGSSTFVASDLMIVVEGADTATRVVNCVPAANMTLGTGVQTISTPSYV